MIYELQRPRECSLNIKNYKYDIARLAILVTGIDHQHAAAAYPLIASDTSTAPVQKILQMDYTDGQLVGAECLLHRCGWHNRRYKRTNGDLRLGKCCYILNKHNCFFFFTKIDLTVIMKTVPPRVNHRGLLMVDPCEYS